MSSEMSYLIALDHETDYVWSIPIDYGNIHQHPVTAFESVR